MKKFFQLFTHSSPEHGQPQYLLLNEAHPSGFIGEDPNVWGKDYPTPDGTGVRDYIHVVDLAEGHRAPRGYLAITPQPCDVFSPGSTDHGTSVLHMVRAFKQASGKRIPVQIGPRRPGDVVQCWAGSVKGQHVLEWRANRGLHEMCQSAWEFSTKTRSYL